MRISSSNKDWLNMMNSSKIDLGTLGWDLLFEESFSPHQLQGLVPGRITQVQRKSCIALTEFGEIEVKVSGLDNDFNIQRIERYLTLASESGSKPVVLFNKSDLCDDPDVRIEHVKRIAPSIPIHSLSAELNHGLDILNRYLGKVKTIALLGSSGVGKSTIINRLIGVDRQKMGPVRESDGHGRHITTYREMIVLPNGGMIIDNPGMNDVFKDIEEVVQRCRFRDCIHESEPGCAVKEALDKGELDPRRYTHYLKLRKEVEFLSIKHNEMVRSTEKAKWKNLAKYGREIRKLKTGED
ncbi:MAG: ribosome small subunit-dependent GTPase A [ANME-2 cluster archaeon]|nr:MAG: ribosome small subunit-dependent GTPase A [ANME-2 cluster archaeon]